MKIVDAHTHVFPQYAELAVRTMDECGVDWCVTLEWHDGFGGTLKEHIDVFDGYPGRFVVFGNVDFGMINEKDFGKNAARQMEQDVEAGMRGLKVYKALGLTYRDGEGNFWRVSDERLDPIWEKAGELHIPVLIHTADPVAFWQPVNEHNFWNGVLYGEYAWWTYYRKDYPSRDELLAERNDVIRRNPNTIFICPHLGSRADCPQSAADDLDALPNLYYDFSARVPILGLPGKHAETTRSFFITYQDRILFGTDLIFDDVNVPAGVQAQCLYQPGEIALQEGESAERKYVETSVEFLKSHIDFLSTDGLQSTPPFKRNSSGFAIQGISLPEEVCEKILCRNAQRLIGI